MQYRALTLCALAPMMLVAACGDKFTGTTNAVVTGTAVVQFVNATGTTISFGTGNAAIVFGGTSTCLTVNTVSPNLTFTNTSNGTTIAGFTPNLTAGGNFTIVAFTDANGNIQFATLDNGFTPNSGQSGLRVFNAAAGSGNVVLNANGAALNNGAATAFGNAGTFFSNAAGTSVFSFNNGTGTSTLATTGNVVLNSGQNSTIFLAPAAAGTTALRTFVTTACQ